ncbi:hypothetical protein Cfla_0412 [Cellulomonas flavigena DSM 20109]|uniref:Uncharacterized protein n=1 Tax=Cellulomonas flavigena (strain ATCC 482 / DSM 20109 / BCRC 11376 / JCM 18109 / NBRC 3775 / NCIMB 8073 / NRS 134) TaxID=446466 RepID=D5UHQ5_CELFN|nr:hypothetical protein [Cellulomonas flavigena]ADG73329.1 hypothetical protein Cfla_0412 [Cellulomonas flavigena DSM 20109]
MDNLWVTSGDDLVTWVADLTAVRDDAPALLGWLRTILAAGEREAVYEVLEAPLAGFRVERDGPFAEHLGRRFDRDGVVDLGHFATSGTRVVDGRRLRVTATLAYVEGGVVVDRPVENLGALLRRLHPTLLDEGAGHMVDCPPIDVRGTEVDVRGTGGRSRRRTEVRFALRSDLWYPYVVGLLAPTSDAERRHDNRPLALRHTPRLNAFLGAARSATLALGGRWELEEQARLAFPGAVTEHGIDLDGDPPALL